MVGVLLAPLAPAGVPGTEPGYVVVRFVIHKAHVTLAGPIFEVVETWKVELILYKVFRSAVVSMLHHRQT